MIDLGPFAILRPLWILAIPVLLALAYLAAKRADGFAAWREIIDPALIPVLTRLGHVSLGARDWRPWIMAVAGILMAMGLAGPAKRNQGAPVFRNLDAIMILMDLSPSMLQGGSLDDAQASVARLLDRSGTRPVALSVFAGETFLVSVPTEEPQQLKTSLGVIDIDTMPITGSRPGRALEQARATLADAAAQNSDVIIVTDGGGIGPDAIYQAETLAQEGVRLSAVFVAHNAPPYGIAPDNEQRLRDLIKTGTGIVVDAHDLATLERLLTERKNLGAEEKARRTILFDDFGPWIFLLGLVVLLPIYRQRRDI